MRIPSRKIINPDWMMLIRGHAQYLIGMSQGLSLRQAFGVKFLRPNPRQEVRTSYRTNCRESRNISDSIQFQAQFARRGINKYNLYEFFFSFRIFKFKILTTKHLNQFLFLFAVYKCERIPLALITALKAWLLLEVDNNQLNRNKCTTEGDNLLFKTHFHTHHTLLEIICILFY